MQNSNTTLVKVKSVVKQPRYKISSHSNTTLVKVKSSQFLYSIEAHHSNTTLVKVKSRAG